LAVSRHSDNITNQIRILTNSFDTGILGTAKALQSHNSLLAAAMASSKLQEQFKAISEQLSPSVGALRYTAGHLAKIDMEALLASAERFPNGVMQAAAKQAIDAQHVIEAFALADSPEECATNIRSHPSKNGQKISVAEPSTLERFPIILDHIRMS